MIQNLFEVMLRVEVHIEQGPVLEQFGFPLGAVKGIAGQTWFKVHASEKIELDPANFEVMIDPYPVKRPPARSWWRLQFLTRLSKHRKIRSLIMVLMTSQEHVGGLHKEDIRYLLAENFSQSIKMLDYVKGYSCVKIGCEIAILAFEVASQLSRVMVLKNLF